MARHVFPAVLAAALLLGACASTPPPGRDPAIVQAIEAAMSDTAAGWNAGDMQRFMAVYSDAPETSFVAGQELLRGKPAMIAMYDKAYDFDDAAKRGTLSFETVDLRALGPAHVLYIARYTLTYPAAEPVSGLTSVVFAREVGGWRIIADHSG